MVPCVMNTVMNTEERFSNNPLVWRMHPTFQFYNGLPDNAQDMLAFQYLIEEIDRAVDTGRIPEASERMTNDDIMAD